MSGWFEKFKAKYQDQYDNDLPFWYEGEEVDRIIKEVERLRAMKVKLDTSTHWKSPDQKDEQIASLTKELDAARRGEKFENNECIRLEDKLRQLEAENAAMREKLAESDKIIHRLRGIEK